jgi:hypothetical protein
MKQRHGTGILALVLVLALAGCESEQDNDQADGAGPLPDAGVGDTSGSDLPASDGVPAADGGLPVIQGDLQAIVAAMAFVPSGGGYTPPTSAELQAFEAGLTTLLLGQHEPAVSLLKSAGLEAVMLLEDSGQTFLLVREPAGSAARGWGLYAFDVAPARPNLVIEVPHTKFDQMTEDQGAEYTVALKPAALLVAGSHRCASTAPSPCSGTTQACSASAQAFRVSDAAHYTEAAFQAAHRVVTLQWPAAVAVQLHGMALVSGGPHAVVSDGTTLSAPSTGLSNQLADALAQELGLPIESCNEPHTSTLCATTNVQGRHSNGSPAPCTVAASAATGRFLHVEQSTDLRDAQRAKVLAALQQVFP